VPNNNSNEAPSSLVPDESDEFVVERIVDHADGHNRELLFRVRWYGYEEGEDTWEQEGNFLGSLLDAIGSLRRTMPARLLVIATTLQHGFVHTLWSIMQRSGEPGDALATFFV
jgi:Chromo (CHRromatin Organisation MOdifier) domain